VAGEAVGGGNTFEMIVLPISFPPGERLDGCEYLIGQGATALILPVAKQPLDLIGLGDP